jgi:hypothetical protein
MSIDEVKKLLFIISYDMNQLNICKIKVKKVVISQEFKPNSAAITVGFLFRKGLLTPDESNYNF